MTFTQFIQNRVGANYTLRYILDNLEEETIENEIDSFFRQKKDAILVLAKENRRFESPVDNVLKNTLLATNILSMLKAH